MKARDLRTRCIRASALLIAIWAVAFVALTVVGIVGMISRGQEQSIALMQRFQARQIAQNAANLAIHPQVSEFDPILTGVSDIGGKYRVTLSSEGARLNINEILKRENKPILKRLFQQWGVGESDAAVAIDSLLDWVDADSTQRLNGAERNRYQQDGRGKLPPNRPFTSVAEMSQVKGMNVVAAARPHWQDAFTIWSDGNLDLNDADADLIAAAADVSIERAKRLIDVRARLKQSADVKQRRWKQLDEPLRLLGLSGESGAKAAQNLTVDGSIWRADSAGTIDTQIVTVSFIYRKSKSDQAILHRIEK